MGSWNATCLISSLPICYGDPVKVLLLVKRKEHRISPKTDKDRPSPIGHVYSHDVWAPIPLVLSGTYADYGQPAIDTSFESEFVYKQIVKAVDQEVMYVKSDGYTADQKFSNLNEFFDKIERGQVQIKDYSGMKNLGFCMIHEEIWEKLVSYENTIKRDQWDIRPSLARTLAGASQFKTIESHSYREKDWNSSLMSMRTPDWVDPNPLSESNLEKSIPLEAPEIQASLQKNSDSFWSISIMMDRLRKIFDVSTSTGSQSREDTAYLHLYKAAYEMTARDMILNGLENGESNSSRIPKIATITELRKAAKEKFKALYPDSKEEEEEE